MSKPAPGRSTFGDQFIAQARCEGCQPDRRSTQTLDVLSSPWNYLDSQGGHVWSFSLEQNEAVTTYLASLLTPEETARSNHYLNREVSRKFSTGRGALRFILSRYTATEPEDLVILTGPQGKPYLGQPRPQPLFFNLSHSGGSAILGISHAGQVGIDLEAIHPVPELHTIAMQYFSSGERAELDAAADQERAFFTTWTLKEAYVKAWGTGLVDKMNASTIRRIPQGTLIRVERETSGPLADPQLEPCWSPDLQAPPGYCAAVIIAAQPAGVTHSI